MPTALLRAMEGENINISMPQDAGSAAAQHGAAPRRERLSAAI
jgi:hypothetical protein